MAKTGTEKPGTAGSQFFVVTGADAGLPADYALLGKVVSGLDVVNKIAKLPTGAGGPMPRDVPKQPVIIEAVTVVGAK